jgi:hypothetical protein
MESIIKDTKHGYRYSCTKCIQSIFPESDIQGINFQTIFTLGKRERKGEGCRQWKETREIVVKWGHSMPGC